MSLVQFANLFVLPVWMSERQDQEKTRVDYRKSLDYWRIFTGDPPLLAIDDFTTSKFLTGLYSVPGAAPRRSVRRR